MSGGDDSALYAAQFTFKLDSNDVTKVHVIREITEPSAHTSSVTGNNTCTPRESTLVRYISKGSESIHLRDKIALTSEFNSLHIRESKTVLDSGLHVLDSSLCQRELEFWIPIVSEIPDSLNCILDFKTHDFGFLKQKFPGFPYVGRNQNLPFKQEKSFE